MRPDRLGNPFAQPQAFCAFGVKHHGFQSELILLDRGERTQGAWQPASNSANSARSAVTAAKTAGSLMEFKSEMVAGIVLPAFEAERSLAHGGKEIRRSESQGNPIGLIQAFQAGDRENQGIVIAPVQLVEPGGNVPAHFQNLHIGPKPPHLRLPP